MGTTLACFDNVKEVRESLERLGLGESMITTLRMNQGRVTIPESIREELGLADDDMVTIDIRQPILNPEYLEKLSRIMKGHGLKFKSKEEFEKFFAEAQP